LRADPHAPDPHCFHMTDYIPPVKIGEVMRAVGIGKVIASKSDNVAIGTDVSFVDGERVILLSRSTG
jgi:NADPH-dependent curcumin reductase CurA